MVSPKLPYGALKLLIAIEGQSPAVVQWVRKGGELYGLQNRDYLREMQVQGRTIPTYMDGSKRIHLPKLQGAYAGRLLDAFEKTPSVRYQWSQTVATVSQSPFLNQTSIWIIERMKSKV